ncbi:MAG TPA: glucose-6-phosphate isomerase [Nitrospirales bacterium]|nr:glucose-6-phosphate isomerase [Nitrospirales bacterium]
MKPSPKAPVPPAAFLGTLEPQIEAALVDLSRSRLIERIWAKDHRVWKPDPTEIVDRLGWLKVAELMRDRLGTLRTFARSVQDVGIRHVVLLGMGGSSLGPEVLRRTFEPAKGAPKLWVLDSTVPGAVRQVTDAIVPSKTLFILASKSGGTIEVMSLYAHFWQLVTKAKGNTGGAQFAAITDHGTSLGALAQERNFRQIFINPSDIGGRYSVLSYFGLVPAALLGMDLDLLLTRATEMAGQCGSDRRARENPGAYLGVTMGMLGQQGRDKVTLIASPKIASFGLWAEQLLAESTGKEGRGLIPVAEEPMLAPQFYGNDRLFVQLRLEGDANAAVDRHVAALQRAGHPVLRLTLRDRYDLGAEFFRWEFATAVASHFLGIHPFDQPNVQESKQNTSRILDEVRRNGKLPSVDAHTDADSLWQHAAPGRYCAVLAYVTPSPKADAALRGLRESIMTAYRIATTAGYGPRYLHSTGQLHKGGPESGLYVQIVEAMTPDLKVPGEVYTFGMLAQAQAIGDLQSLQSHHRPVTRIRLSKGGFSALRQIIPRPARSTSPRSRAARRR